MDVTKVVKKAVKNQKKDSTKMLDIIRDVQAELGFVSDEACAGIAKEMKLSTADVEGVVSFYHFFSKKPVGKYSVYLNNSAVSCMMGFADVRKAFEKEAGCAFGSVTADGKIGLFETSCIGMSDQEPAALINGTVFTSLNAAKVKDIVAGLKAGKDVQDLVKNYGDGNNKSDLIKSMVNNNIQKKGKVMFAQYETGSGLKKALKMKPDAVIEEVKTANLRGRGGAGFPTGMKWEFTRKEKSKKKYIICNGDEGEPGTFKDRVIFTELAPMLFEGMAIAGYAIGANEGILYLRNEYQYLLPHLESVLKELKKKKILGANAGGKKGFNFKISITLGAGAYICGEESALIESAEGKRGETRNRPPFPAQYGYLEKPTSVNNVETLASVCKIMTEGGKWFAGIGTEKSKGTKLLSISGDCKKPGVYEVDFGMSISQMLEECGSTDAKAVQVAGPSGVCIGKKDFGRKICFGDLATGGSMIVFGPQRDLLQTVKNFMEFFADESCGGCSPCKAGNVILLKRLEKIMEGHGTATDLAELESWCKIVKATSRCGLGQTSPNPIQSTIQNFRELYEAKLRKDVDYGTEFTMAGAVKDYCDITGRKPHGEVH